MFVCSKLYPGVLYDVESGRLYRRKLLNIVSDEIDRELFPDAFGIVSYSCCVSGKTVRKKIEILLYEILHGKLPADHKVYFKDFDSTNYKGSNIGVMSKIEYTRLKDSLYNAENCKVIRHPTDMLIYLVKYKHDNRMKTRRCHDIVQALRIQRAVTYTALKYLNKYYVTK